MQRYLARLPVVYARASHDGRHPQPALDLLPVHAPAGHTPAPRRHCLAKEKLLSEIQVAVVVAVHCLHHVYE